MNKQNILSVIKDYVIITLSCLLYAFSFVCFFDTNRIPMGGFTGISQIIRLFVPVLPIGLIVFLINVPIMLIGIKKQGFSILFSTVYAVTVSNAMIDIMDKYITFPEIDPLLASLYGGGLMGVSLGIMLLKNATTGGTELAAKLLKYVFPSISIGKICLTIDVSVVILYSVFTGENGVNLVMYGIIAMYLCSKTMDMVVYGSINAKMAYIVSAKSEEIKQALLDIELGVTILSGKGGYSGNNVNVIMCVVRPTKMPAVKKLVSQIDPDKAFVIVTDAKEVFGEGFGEYSEGNL